MTKPDEKLEIAAREYAKSELSKSTMGECLGLRTDLEKLQFLIADGVKYGAAWQKAQDDERCGKLVEALNEIMIEGLSDGKQQLPPNKQSEIAYNALKEFEEGGKLLADHLEMQANPAKGKE